MSSASLSSSDLSTIGPKGSDRQPLLGHSRSELAALLADHIDRSYRIDQIYHALHILGVRKIDEITVLSKALRGELARRFCVGMPSVADRAAAEDGTTKYLFRLGDGATIEVVDIPTESRQTLCLSSQAGCALACKFCVTGFWGAGRNLTAGEIIGQVLSIRGLQGAEQEGLNLVFMGMGEPLHNLENVRKAIEILTETISWRRITVSTVGVVPGIEALARWEKRPNLAVSLHAPDDRRRSLLMPINDTFPIARLLESLRRYPLESGRRITFEYLLIRDFNDQLEDADALARLLRSLQCKINLIPVNPDPVLGPKMVPPERKQTEAFRARLRANGVPVTVRQRRGDDVSAACGQLRAGGREPRGFRRSNLSL